MGIMLEFLFFGPFGCFSAVAGHIIFLYDGQRILFLTNPPRSEIITAGTGMKIVEVGLRRAKEKADTVMTAGHDYPFSPGLDTDNAVGAESIAEHYSVDAGVKTIDNLLYPFRHLRRGSVQPLIKVVSLDSIEAPGDRLD